MSNASTSSSEQRFAFVTLITTDTYLPGACVLAHSLRQVHSSINKPSGFLTPADTANLGPEGLSNRSSSEKKVDLVCLVTPATVSVQTVKTLLRYFDKVVGVEPLSFASLAAAKANERGYSRAKNDPEAKEARRIRTETRKKLALLGRPDLGEGAGAALTKLHAWRLTGYDKIIYLDADILVLRPIAHLFSITSPLAAAPDIGWPDAFNSGLLVLSPSLLVFSEIRNFAVQYGSWDGADQGLLNDFFGSEQGTSDVGPGGGWQRLPFRYNVTPNAGYTFAPAYQRYGAGIMTAHFIGQHKPWNRPKPTLPRGISNNSATLADHDILLYRWHETFEQCYPQILRMKSGGAQVVHTERGVEVIESRAFTVPTYKAVWDLEGQSSSSNSDSSSIRHRPRRQRAPSSNSVFRQAGQAEDLKEMFTPSVVAASAAAEIDAIARISSATPSEGIYISLPLDSRTSLMPAQMDSDDEEYNSSDSEKTIGIRSPQAVRNFTHESQEQLNSGQWSPPKVSWDPAKEPPPTGGGTLAYQMRDPVDTFYTNVWDEPISRQSRSQQLANFDSSSQKQTLNKLQREHFFDNLGSEQPDIRKVKAVFPWEGSDAQKSLRTFPEEDPSVVVPGSRDMTASLEAGGGTRSPDLGASTSASDSSSNRQNAASPNLGAGGIPASISYTNAWDQMSTSDSTKKKEKSRGVQTQSDQASRSTQTNANKNRTFARVESGHDDNSADQSADGDDEISSSDEEEIQHANRRSGAVTGAGNNRKSASNLARNVRNSQVPFNVGSESGTSLASGGLGSGSSKKKLNLFGFLGNKNYNRQMNNNWSIDKAIEKQQQFELYHDDLPKSYNSEMYDQIVTQHYGEVNLYRRGTQSTTSSSSNPNSTNNSGRSSPSITMMGRSLSLSPREELEGMHWHTNRRNDKSKREKVYYRPNIS